MDFLMGLLHAGLAGMGVFVVYYVLYLIFGIEG